MESYHKWLNGRIYKNSTSTAKSVENATVRQICQHLSKSTCRTPFRWHRAPPNHSYAVNSQVYSRSGICRYHGFCRFHISCLRNISVTRLKMWLPPSWTNNFAEMRKATAHKITASESWKHVTWCWLRQREYDRYMDWTVCTHKRSKEKRSSTSQHTVEK